VKKKKHQFPVVQQNAPFDLFRLSHSKREVGVCPNTLRKFFKEGLPCYKKGKAVFVSRAQFAQFVMQSAA